MEGWDIKPQKNFPFVFHLGDAMEADLSDFDFVWASPPCQEHTALRARVGKHYECFIERTRAKLEAWGGPYILENVVGAPLRRKKNRRGHWDRISKNTNKTGPKNLCFMC